MPEGGRRYIAGARATGLSPARPWRSGPRAAIAAGLALARCGLHPPIELVFGQ
ncbi:MAG: hypothetical protein ACRDVP_11625 [Acidimicrobiales bacterium]